MKKVYLVTDGSYSDYCVFGVYSTREKAEKAKLLLNADNDIEEFDVDDIPDAPPGLLPFRVWMDRDGNTHQGIICNGVPRANARDFVEKVQFSNWNGVTAVFSVWARDAEHARKIANERRIALLADGQFPREGE